MMFKRLISSESGHAIAIPVAISIVACMAVKAMRIHGVWRLETVDTCLVIVALGALVGLVVLILNVYDRIQSISNSLESIAQYLKRTEHNDRIRETVAEICAISREVSKDVKKLESIDPETATDQRHHALRPRVVNRGLSYSGSDSTQHGQEEFHLREYDKLT